MGLFSWIREKISDFVYWIEDRLSGRSYSSDNMEDHIDVDAVLAEFRNSIQKDVNEVESKCMKSILDMFSGLKGKTREKFPDLVEIIDSEQQCAERELSGTVIRYIKEHLSKNDMQFLSVLEMRPGNEKKEALRLAAERVMKEAEKDFNRKLKEYVEDILWEFTDRLETRITDQYKQLNEHIVEMKGLEEEARNGKINVDALRDKSTPVMEAAGCIISLLETEM